MQRHLNWSGIALLLLVSSIAASFLYAPGTVDMQIWDSWMREISSFGLIDGYAHSGVYAHDYPPFTFVMLAAVNQCADLLGINQFLALKWSLLLFLLATSACFYWFTRNLVLTAALEFTLILNSVALGYLDIYFAPFLIAGFFCLQRGNLNCGVLLFAVSCLIKWQPLIISPFVFLYVLNVAKEGPAHDKLPMKILPFTIAIIAIAVPALAVFGTSFIRSLEQALTHPYLSGNALNLSWLHTWVLHLTQPETYGPLMNGQVDYIVTDRALVSMPEKVLFYASYGVIIVIFARHEKTFERLIIYSVLGYLSYFMFNAGVHENHLFLVSCLAWMLVFVNSGHLLHSINLSIAANVNLFLFYGIFGRPLPFSRVVAGLDVTVWFAVANLCLFGGLLFHTFKADGIRTPGELPRSSPERL